ncbi:hypothetical protein DZF91_02335 [Actinomadura logoneensis]|uniref:Secreted protein n=1 Tax=Actinomadura logoneensis TaxID=2293572 RepID=A0A372JTD9_9ACTN|nr:hypothetical protein [Actinomadura logoneensis]RFU43220.1 hypothetical protein DZF91_02335 [Actinomadura logoneensis]
MTMRNRSFSKWTGRGMAAGVAALATTAGLMSGTAAHADDPMPVHDFADCPVLPAPYVKEGSVCIEAIVTSGTFQLGKFNQQITSPIKMTFASALNPETELYTPIFGKMQADKMLVQPGIFGDPIVTAVYAKPEYAGVFDQPTGPDFHIKLGMRIRLTNPFLGGSCVIGDTGNPILLDLTTGTTNPPAGTAPITGKPATIVQRTPFVVRSATHVDNTFSVPGAKGCALGIGLVNAIVNLQAGVPSAAGKNQMVFNEYIGQKAYTALP